MTSALVSVFEALFFPPLPIFLLQLLAITLLLRRRRSGMTLLILATLLLYASSSPLLSGWLLRSLQVYPPVDQANMTTSGAQAIVVLGAGRYPKAGDFGHADTVSLLGLARIRYAAHMQRLTGLPILASGGRPNQEPLAEATLMKEVLEKEFGVPVRWIETKSNNTFENALYSKKILDGEGITRIYLVTHAWHMRRALWSFERAGMHALPAPTHFAGSGGTGKTQWVDLLPSASAWKNLRLALHEYAGLWWYQLRR